MDSTSRNSATLIEVTDVLEAALERRYSASPHERFLTGGTELTFSNFDSQFDRDVLSVREDQDQEEVARELARYDFLAIPVVDEQYRLVGIITDGDLRRAIEHTSHDSLAKLTCDDFMTRQPIVATPQLLAFDALRLMEDRSSQISVLPVVDENKICVGLIRLHDIVRSGL